VLRDSDRVAVSKMSPRLRSPRQDWGRGQRPNSVETSAWDPNSYSHKSRALTNLETRFEEFESLPPSHTISPCVFNNLRSRVIFTSELASTSNSVFSSLSGSHHRRGPSGHRRSPAVGQTRGSRRLAAASSSDTAGDSAQNWPQQLRLKEPARKGRQNDRRETDHGAIHH